MLFIVVGYLPPNNVAHVERGLQLEAFTPFPRIVLLERLEGASRRRH